jgi:hypothetical protein
VPDQEQSEHHYRAAQKGPHHERSSQPEAVGNRTTGQSEDDGCRQHRSQRGGQT